MTLRLTNTLTRKKEVFTPADARHVTMYVCGPTVYNFAHIGNARPAVVFDVLYRLLKSQFKRVVYARNFTDVDDKINAAAKEIDQPISVVTDRYVDAYQADMAALGVLTPDVEPRVTEHVPEIISMVEQLIARDHAYAVAGHVLFHVPSFSAYGALSGRNRDEMIDGARIEVAPFKRDPADFVLWKPSTPDLPGWDSPWGRGRPGWHIECSAMIGQHLGASIDIHGGGQDLIFPHHENEIAQGTCAHDGQVYCRHWVHNGFVTVNGQKMSKSLGNVLLVRDLLAEAPGEAIRLALLSAHYRKPLDWSAQRLNSARQTLIRCYDTLASFSHVDTLPQTTPDPEFLALLMNDLNVPGALVRLRVLLAQLEESDTESRQLQAKSVLLASAGLLGILGQPPRAALGALRPEPSMPVTSPSCDRRLKALLRERENARRARNFRKADALRNALEAEGFVVEDTPTGSVLRPSGLDKSTPGQP